MAKGVDVPYNFDVELVRECSCDNLPRFNVGVYRVQHVVHVSMEFGLSKISGNLDAMIQSHHWMECPRDRKRVDLVF